MPHWSLSRAITSTRVMVRLAEEYGVRSDNALMGTELTRERIDDPATEVGGLQELAVLRNILRELGPTIPFALVAGMRYQVATHGMWGFALLSSPNVRSSVETSIRYFDLTYSFNRLKFEVEGGEGRFLYDDSDNPEDLRAALVERDLGALVTIERTMHGKVYPATSLQLRGARPSYAAMLESLFNVDVHWGAAQNCLTFDAALLDLPQPFADEFGLRVSEEQCRMLSERRGKRAGAAGRVREEILRNPGEFPSMKTVALRLGLSTRTLHNQLAREHTSYRDLVEEIRGTLAEELLGTSLLTVEEIAQRLGYAETSSFIAAFKRWKGVPPGSYKRSNVGSNSTKHDGARVR